MSFGKGMPRSTFEINLETICFGGVFKLKRHLQTPRHESGRMFRFSLVVLAKALFKILRRTNVRSTWITKTSNQINIFHKTFRPAPRKATQGDPPSLTTAPAKPSEAPPPKGFGAKEGRSGGI